MEINVCDFCNKKISDRYYTNFGINRFELCKECHKKLKLIIDEYEEKSSVLQKKQDELFNIAKIKIEQLKEV